MVFILILYISYRNALLKVRDFHSLGYFDCFKEALYYHLISGLFKSTDMSIT